MHLSWSVIVPIHLCFKKAVSHTSFRLNQVTFALFPGAGKETEPVWQPIWREKHVDFLLIFVDVYTPEVYPPWN